MVFSEVKINIQKILLKIYIITFKIIKYHKNTILNNYKILFF